MKFMSIAPTETGVSTDLPQNLRRLPVLGASKEVGILVLLIVLCVAGWAKNHDFISVDNLQNMAQLVGLYGIFSLGLGIIIITGGIDLSVGSAFALLGVLMAMMLSEHHWPAALAVFAIIALGMGLGTIHAILITRLGLQPFIVTLCGLLLYRGLARFIAHDETKGFGTSHGFEHLRDAATGNVFFRLRHLHFFHVGPGFRLPVLQVSPNAHGLPMPFLILIIISIILWVVLHRSIYGRYLFAVGRNEEAARYSGINARGIIASAYILSGALVGIAGILIAFYTNSVSPSSHGNFYELYGIAAAVLGGCSLRGGEGSIIGILIGAALLQVLQNLVNLLGIDSSLNFAVMGAVILLGVIADQLFKRRKARA